MKLFQAFLVIFATMTSSMNSSANIISSPAHPTKQISLQDLLLIQTNTTPGNLTLSPSAGQETITSTGPKTIRFLQAFFYSDTSCTTLLDIASIIDFSGGFSFVNGQTISLNTHSAYLLSNQRGVNVSNIACMRLYVSGGHFLAQGVSCQNYTDETCSNISETCTSNQIKNVAWTLFPTPCFSLRAYISNNAADSVRQCSYDTLTGELTCGTDIPGFSSPTGIAINNGHAFVANDTTVSKCDVDASSGSLSNCNSTGSGFNSPRGIALNKSFAYVVNVANNTVTKCTVDGTTGTLSSCAVTGSGFNSPRFIAINNKYAYITNNGSNTVSICSIDDTTNELNNCNTTTGANMPAYNGFTAPSGIAFDNGYAYIATPTLAQVAKCQVDASSGALSNCDVTGSGFSDPTGITVNNGFAHVSNATGDAVTKCEVDSVTGALSNCASTGSGFSTPSAISLY